MGKTGMWKIASIAGIALVCLSSTGCIKPGGKYELLTLFYGETVARQAEIQDEQAEDRRIYYGSYNGGPGQAVNTMAAPAGPPGPQPLVINRSGSPAQTAADLLLLRAGQRSGRFVFADFNGDGVPDTAALGPNSMLVLLYNADGSTLSSETYPIPNLGTSIVTADFNGDGALDLALIQNGTSGPGNILILLGHGDGTFGAPTAVSAGQYPFYLVAADLNGDGVPDLAVTILPSGSGAGSVGVLIGQGNGSFAPIKAYPVGLAPATIVADDFNGDGKTDLVTLDAELGIVNKVWVLPGRGDGTFQTAISTPTGTGNGYLSYADINRDGNLDLIIADQTASAMAVMMGNGDGTFQTATEYLAASQTTSILPVPLQDGNTMFLVADSDAPQVVALFATSDGTVRSPRLQTVGQGPAAIATADLNGDTKPDLVITDSEAGNLLVKLGSGGGLFGAAATYPLGSQPGALALGDVNGDGKIDALVADGNGIEVLLGNGNGTFAPAITVPASAMLSSLVIADFNGDGKPDIAATDNTSGGVLIFLGKGDGTFQTDRTISLGSGLIALSAAGGDFNGDGKPDLIVAFSPTDNTQPGGLSVLLGKGDGTFQAPSNTTLPGPFVQQGIGAALTAPMVVGDLNKDGKPDVATVVSSGAGNETAVYIGNGDGSFQPPNLQATQTSPPMMAITDVNGDGNPDLLLADCCGLSEGSFVAGNGNGTFQPEQPLPSGPNPRWFAIADFNGDGAPDAAVIGQVEEAPQPDRGTLAIALNTFSSANTTPAATTTTASPVSATFSPNVQTVTASATVTSNSTPVSGGTVTFTALGTSVSANVVSGTASVSVTIPGGTAAGSYPIQAVYNPATGFATSNGTQQLTIAKASPVVNWATPASIVAGTALGSSQLDATASVSGAFTYTPPAGTVLTVGNSQTLSVLFTPADTTDYNTHTATVSINVTAPSAPALTIAKTHSATFTAGATGTYMITVGNATGAGSTGGAVTVTDNAPTGLSVTAMNGTGWSCPTLPTCMRSDTLQPGQSYLPIMVTVSVAASAPSSLTNMATVSGGGSASATATDPTSIGTSGPSQFAFTWTANPVAGGSVTPASGSLFTAGTTLTVSATPTACYLFSSYSGALIGTTNPAMLQLNAPQSVVANFTLNAKTNVTPQMTTQLSGFRYNRITNTYLQSLTVTNGGAALTGPVYVALDSLTPGATLMGAQGTTQCASPAGSPYVLLNNIGIGAGQSLTLSLQLTSTGAPPFLYTPRYLAGNGLQ